MSTFKNVRERQIVAAQLDTPKGGAAVVQRSKSKTCMVILGLFVLVVIPSQIALAQNANPRVQSAVIDPIDPIAGVFTVEVDGCCGDHCGAECRWHSSKPAGVHVERVPDRQQQVIMNEPSYPFTAEMPWCNYYAVPIPYNYACVGDSADDFQTYSGKAQIKCWNEYSGYTPMGGGFVLDHMPVVSLSIVKPEQEAGEELYIGKVDYIFPQTRTGDDRSIAVEWYPSGTPYTQDVPCAGGFDLFGKCEFWIVGPPPVETDTGVRIVATACNHSFARSHDTENLPKDDEPKEDKDPMGKPVLAEDPEEKDPKDPCDNKNRKAEGGAPIRFTNGNMRLTDGEPVPSSLPSIFSRTYDSIKTDSGVFGIGWTSIFDSRVIDHGDQYYEVLKPTNNSVYFSRIATFPRQEWPRGTPSGDLRIIGGQYVYTTPDGETIRKFQVSNGRLVSIESRSSGEGVFVSYNATTGHPETVSDSRGNVLWTLTTDQSSGRITRLSTGNVIWTYLYSAEARLEEVGMEGVEDSWRLYEYNDDGLLTEVADGEGHIIEQHDYYPISDPLRGGWAYTSRVANEHIIDIDYDVDEALLDRSLKRNLGETAVRMTYASGLYSDYYIRPSHDRPHRVFEIRGHCSCSSAGEFALYADDWEVGPVRKQDARGYITTWEYDDSNRVKKVERGLAPPGCDPANDPGLCLLGSPEVLSALDLSSAVPEETVNYSYDDPNWPNKRTSVCRESVVKAGEDACRTFTYDSQTGIVLSSTTSGWEWDHELDVSVSATRTSTTTLYDGVVSAVFDPTVFHGDLTNFTSPMAAVSQPAGQVMQTQGPLADSSDLVQFVYYPDATGVPAHLIGRLAARKDPGNLVTVYDDYDLFGNVVRVIDPRGVATSFEYNVLGQLESTTLEASCAAFPDDPLCDQDLITTYDYASNRNLMSTTSSGGAATSYGYDSWSRRITVKRGPTGQDPLEKIEYSLDPASGRHLDETTSAAEGAAWTTMRRVDSQYNDYGRLVRLERPVSETDPSPAAELYDYDRAGNVVEFTDPLHATANVKYFYDALGRLERVEQLAKADPEIWVVTSYEFDTHGNLTKVIDGNGNETSYGIDDFGRTYEISSPETGTTYLTYDAGGRLVKKTDARDVIETRDYDSAGRLDTVTYAVSGNTVVVENTYNAFGQRERADVRTGGVTTSTQSWTFDRRGAVHTADQQIGDGDAVTMTYGYDLDGNLVKRTRGCEEIGYELDYAGRPIRVTGSPNDCSGAELVFADEIGYLPFGPIASMRRGDVEETFGYDWQYRLSSQTADLAMPSLPGPIGTSGLGSSGIGVSAQNSRFAAYADRSYDYDAAGNLVGVIDLAQPQRTRTYTYDDLGRLETTLAPHSFGELGYVYDLIGNRTQQSFGHAGGQVVTDYTYEKNLLNKNTPLLQSVGGQTVEHDVVGNLTTDESSTYAYTPRNTLASQSIGGTQRFGFLYNAEGIRVRTNGSDPVGSSVDHYLGLDGRPAYEVVKVGATTGERSFVYLSDRLLARFDKNGNVENVISDHIGYPLATFEFDGDLLWEAEALPFGEVHQVFQGDETTDPLLRYPGQWALDGIGGTDNPELYYNQHRWYRPEWGRYTQVDPLISLLGYGYSGQSPVAWIDPLGLYTCGPWVGPYSMPPRKEAKKVPTGWAEWPLSRKPGLRKAPRLIKRLADLIPTASICCRTIYPKDIRPYGTMVHRLCECGGYDRRVEEPVPEGFKLTRSFESEDKHGCCLRREEAEKLSGAYDTLYEGPGKPNCVLVLFGDCSDIPG